VAVTVTVTVTVAVAVAVTVTVAVAVAVVVAVALAVALAVAVALTVAVALALAALAVEQPIRPLAPKGGAHGCATVSAEPRMANRDRAYSLSGRRTGLGPVPFLLVTFLWASKEK
jgi:hypothetical protein